MLACTSSTQYTSFTRTQDTCNRCVSKSKLVVPLNRQLGSRLQFQASVKPQSQRRCQRHLSSQRSHLVMAASSDPLKVMIFGAPASGKGTQCAKIVEKYGLVHISVGDLLRAEVAAGTEDGKKAKAFMDRGDLVPNEVVVDMVKHRLAQDDVKQHGWLLDGYPRSAEQAKAIEAANIRPDLFLLLDVPDDKIVERVSGRRTDPETGEIYHLTFKPPPAEIIARLTQRSDDTEDKVRNRLKTYHDNLDAVLGFYEKVTVRVGGDQAMEAVFAELDAALLEALGDAEGAVAATA